MADAAFLSPRIGALPAPVKGDALILTPIDGQVPEAMQPLMAAVAASAGSDQLSRNRAQRMLWALMSAGTQEGERVSQATLKDLDAIAPGGAQQFLDYHKAQLAKQGASRPVSVNARDADDAAIAREILRLQEAGERMDNGKGFGYSMVNDGSIAARATGTAPLEAKVELLNDTYDEQAFRPGAYNFKALAKNQPIVPKQTSYARVISGEIPILLDYDFNAYRGQHKDGAPVAFVIPKEGTVVQPYVMGLVNNGPHAENGKKVLDFVLSDESQTMWGNAFLRPVFAEKMSDEAKRKFLPDADYARAKPVDLKKLGAAQAMIVERFKNEVK